MKLISARVCLDCEEIHDARECPSCTSESSAFLTRWIPTQNRREQIRIEQQRKLTPRSTQDILVSAGLAGGAAYLIRRWWKAVRQSSEKASESNEPDSKN